MSVGTGRTRAGQVSEPSGPDHRAACRPAAPSTCSCAALGKEFETRTGASVVVENRAGANTILAANACKTAAPDGYTFCLLTRSTVSINPEIYRKLSYDPLKDFEPVTNGFFGQQIVILNKNVPVKTLAELVDVLQEESRQAQLRLDGARRRLPSHHGVAQA